VRLQDSNTAAQLNSVKSTPSLSTPAISEFSATISLLYSIHTRCKRVTLAADSDGMHACMARENGEISVNFDLSP